VVGIAAMCRRPLNPWRSALISCAHGAVSPTMRRAQSSTFSPSGVKPLEARAAVDQQHAHLLLELLHPGRQRRLGDAAGSAARPKCLRGQREEEFSLSIKMLALLRPGSLKGSITGKIDSKSQSYRWAIGGLFLDQSIKSCSRGRKHKDFNERACHASRTKRRRTQAPPAQDPEGPPD
jgi:hypothetical protein